MSAGLEILSTRETSAADAAAIAAGTAGTVLMARAGAAVAAAIRARWSPRPVAIFCGPGNNGGDGYVVARELAAAGWAARTVSPTPREALKGDAAWAAAAWEGPHADGLQGPLSGDELAVDALFGAGLDRPPAEPAAALLRAAEAGGAPIVAVDLPSGLPGDRAAPLGYAPRCALTVTFHRKKPAHVLEPGRSFCGEVVVADIGLAAPQGARLFENGPALWSDRLPWPGPQAHKHARGGAVVVSGPMTRTGAARLAARGALRIGAGLVTVLSPPDAAPVNAGHLEAVMLEVFSGPRELARAAERARAAVIGPAAGVTADTRDNVLALAGTGAGLVIDADALTVFRERPPDLFAVLDAQDVLTPHPGEFERLFPGLLDQGPTRIEAARAAARVSGANVLLKGPDTVVSAPDGRAVVNANGSPFLATAGSGDVLAGFIGGLIAQGMDAFWAACAAAWIHAEAGAGFGPGLISEDLPGLAPQVLRRLKPAG